MTPTEHIALTDETAIYTESVERILNTCTREGVAALLELNYEAQGLADESGEVLGKVKKILRDYNGDIGNEEVRVAVKKEMGDVLYYFSRLCKRFGWSYEELMDAGMAKLLDRKARGVLQGNGDNR